jgi:uncharacterized delta-60 repeat protein
MKAPTLNSLVILAVFSLSYSNFASVQIDPAFQANIPGPVNAIALRPDGSILVGGDFENGLSALASNGSAGPALGRTDASVQTIAVRDGLVLFGGRFSAVNGVLARNFARVLPSGELAGGLAGGSVDCVVIDARGRAVLGGSFHTVHGEPAVYVARLTAAGELDPSFSAALRASFAIEAGVTALAVQADGKILVGGNFETEHGFQYLVRLNEDGSIDGSYSGDHGAMLYVKTILPLPNGQCFVAGQTYSGKGFVRRLNADRSAEVTFSAPEFDNSVHALALAEDGKLVAGGAFRSPGSRLTRLNADGSVDSAWNVGFDGPVNALAFEGTGRLLVGGSFERGVARVLDSKLSSYATNGSVFRGTIEGEIGKRYVIESSADLVHWAEFGIATSAADGVEVVDREASATVKRFFRARLVQ